MITSTGGAFRAKVYWSRHSQFTVTHWLFTAIPPAPIVSPEGNICTKKKSIG
jgi:hypothetical protein